MHGMPHKHAVLLLGFCISALLVVELFAPNTILKIAGVFEREAVATAEAEHICVACSGVAGHSCLCTARICEACAHLRGVTVTAEQRAQWSVTAGALTDRVYADDGDADAETFALVEGVLKWVSNFDRDQNALLCNEEVNAMPRVAAAAFLPRYERLVAPGAAPMCLRFNMVEAALWKLPRTALRQLAANHSMSSWHVSAARAYKFQGVPDFVRRGQWPYMSQAGADAAATWVYHGENGDDDDSGSLPWRWSPSDVQTGDIISVRGPGVSHSFWRNVHPHIKVRYIALVQTEAEDVTPGMYAAKVEDENLGFWYMLNHDEKHTGESAKLVPFPIGQLCCVDAAKLFALAASAPPPLSAARSTATVLILFTDGTNPDRARARVELRRSLGGSGLLSEPAAALPGSLAVLAYYAKVKFVVSPWGAGPDCHRTWEAVAMGAVPIVLAHKGLAPLFAGEPILVVERWADVTPALLASWRPPVRQPGALRSRSLHVGYWHKQLEARANTLRAEAVEALLV